MPQFHGTSLPPAPILPCAHHWPHCSEQNAPVCVGCCIRTANVLGQISPLLRPLLGAVVPVLVWGLQQGCVCLGTAGVSRQALAMERAAFSHEREADKEAVPSSGLHRPGGDGAAVSPVDLHATSSLADSPACVSHPPTTALKEPKCGCCSRAPRPCRQPAPRWWLPCGLHGGAPRLGVQICEAIPLAWAPLCHPQGWGSLGMTRSDSQEGRDELS